MLFQNPPLLFRIECLPKEVLVNAHEQSESINHELTRCATHARAKIWHMLTDTFCMQNAGKIVLRFCQIYPSDNKCQPSGYLAEYTDALKAQIPVSFILPLSSLLCPALWL